jgi:hypothetical protein
MLVAMVTVPGRPAWAMMSASLGVELGVQHPMGNLFPRQQLGEIFTGLDGGGADQHRRLLGHALLDVGDDRIELSSLLR